ncbi:MAG: alpha/beta hydrolase [Opitutae bacterium]|nr:alpha/beta hydrolase [Opitutae bacterium]
MISPRLLLPAFFLMSSLGALALADEAKIKPVGTATVYKTVAGRELHAYVLNPPDWKSSDHRPAIVFFHGGGWEIGHGAPTQFNAQGEYFSSRGAVCVQIEYRLIASNREEAPLAACQDAKSAIRWVRSHAADLGVDPERIVASGGSAGGQLAAFVGMVEGTDDPADDPKVSSRPAATVMFNPALLQPSAADSKNLPPELIERYASISPYLHVSKDDAPGLILVGSRDPVLPGAVLQSFQERCRAAGLKMEAVVYPGEGHGFFGLKRSADRFFETTVEMDKFLGSLGVLQGAPTLTREQVQQLAARIPLNPKSKSKSPQS